MEHVLDQVRGVLAFADAQRARPERAHAVRRRRHHAQSA